MKKSTVRRISAQDVADYTGVSQSTVSRVFNKNWTGPLSPEVVEKVKRGAKELGYRPNSLAQILNSDRSYLVAIVVSSQFNLFFGEVLVELSNKFSKAGFRTMLFTCSPSNDIGQILDQCLGFCPDAVVITSSAVTHQACVDFAKAPVPIVLFNGYLPGMPINCVHADNQSGCAMMADLFVKLGHEDIVYFTTGEGSYDTYQPRQEGFINRLHTYGNHNCRIHHGYYNYDKTLVVARTFFKNNPPPQGIFCAGDENTYAVIDAAAEQGLVAGKDLSVAGFYGPGMQYKAYDITCLKQDVAQMTTDTVERVCSLMENPDQSTCVITRPMTLYVGKSTIKNG